MWFQIPERHFGKSRNGFRLQMKGRALVTSFLKNIQKYPIQHKLSTAVTILCVKMILQISCGYMTLLKISVYIKFPEGLGWFRWGGTLALIHAGIGFSANFPDVGHVLRLQYVFNKFVWKQNDVIMVAMVLSIVKTIYTPIDGRTVRNTTQIVRFMGPTWGPPGSCRPQMGPMLAPWSLLSG